MTSSAVFWVLMTLALVLGFVPAMRSSKVASWFPGMSPLTWALLALLGYKVFGWPIQG